MLTSENLHVTVENKSVLKGVTLTVSPGQVCAIMGYNGSGKTTLARTLIGDPHCTITSGSLRYRFQDLIALTPDKRAQLGLFLAYQHPCTLAGVSVFTLLREAYQACHKTSVDLSDFKALVRQKMAFLSLDATVCDRSVNEGFSGGEKKKLELLQMLVLRPTCIILDEIDAGLDIDSRKLVARCLDTLRSDNPETQCIVISHNPHLFNTLHPDVIHIMSDGVITTSGDYSLLTTLEARGYDAFKTSRG